MTVKPFARSVSLRPTCATTLAGVGPVGDGLVVGVFAAAGFAAWGALDDAQPARPTMSSPVNVNADVRARVVLRCADTGVSSRLGAAPGPRWTFDARGSFDAEGSILDRLTRNGCSGRLESWPARRPSPSSPW